MGRNNQPLFPPPSTFPRSDRSDKPQRAASILILGKPGSGKTTVLRDICRKVSEEQVQLL